MLQIFGRRRRMWRSGGAQGVPAQKPVTVWSWRDYVSSAGLPPRRLALCTGGSGSLQLYYRPHSTAVVLSLLPPPPSSTLSPPVVSPFVIVAAAVVGLHTLIDIVYILAATHNLEF
ncbi:hypothetical protein C8J57DRAFT_1719326 [Mycena rebaudengoi]|nr:hypothetical protein C8J57DRAFT_1719326 [Mycena rebaudengoi]